MQIPSKLIFPSEREPLKIKSIVLHSETFIYKRKQYAYTDVRKLDFNWFAFDSVRPGLPITLDMSFDVVDLKKRIKLSTGIDLFFILNMSKNKNFYSAYSHIAKSSFDIRYQDYLRKIESKGYFHYHDHVFSKDRISKSDSDEIILDPKGMIIKDHPLGFILFTKKDVEATTWQKLTPFNPRMLGIIGVHEDKDVLERLFTDYYSIIVRK